MTSSSSSSWRGPITEWLTNVCSYYFGSKKDESTVAVVDTALSLIENYMAKHPQHAKQQWQNLAMAAFLTSIDLLDLAVDTKPLWDKCEQSCDPKRVTEIQKLLKEVPEPDTKEEKKAAPPATIPTPKFTVPATPVIKPPKPATPAPTPKIPFLEAEEEEDDDDDDMKEVPDEEQEQQQSRLKAQKQKSDDKYLAYVLQESKLRVWPYVFDVDVSSKHLSCMDRVFRTYAINLAKQPLSKQDVQNIAAGTILATLEHLHLLPVLKEGRLIGKLYDDYPLSSKQGIKQAWEAIKNTPNLLESKLSGLLSTSSQ